MWNDMLHSAATHNLLKLNSTLQWLMFSHHHSCRTGMKITSVVTSIYQTHFNIFLSSFPFSCLHYLPLGPASASTVSQLTFQMLFSEGNKFHALNCYIPFNTAICYNSDTFSCFTKIVNVSMYVYCTYLQPSVLFLWLLWGALQRQWSESVPASSPVPSHNPATIHRNNNPVDCSTGYSYHPLTNSNSVSSTFHWAILYLFNCLTYFTDSCHWSWNNGHWWAILQQQAEWVGCSCSQTSFHCMKCNSINIRGSVTNHHITAKPLPKINK